MSLGLPAVVDLIAEDFEDDSTPCSIFYGPDHIAEHNDANRIVVIPTTDTFGPPQYVQAATGDLSSDGQNPRPILTRNEGAKAEIWAVGATQEDPQDQQRADYDALHDLINRFIVALHRANPGNYTVTGGQTIETTRVDRRGYVYRLEFSLQVPIVDVAWGETKTYDTESDVEQATTVEMINPDDTVIESVIIS